MHHEARHLFRYVTVAGHSTFTRHSRTPAARRAYLVPFAVPPQAINFFKKMLKLHDLNPDSDATIVPRARVYDLLAEGYLADGRVKPAREVVISALELLDERVTGSREWMTRRVGHEVSWLSRPLLLKKSRAISSRPARRSALDVEMMVVRLYEHLGTAWPCGCVTA